ncbi:U-box domain-containing protein [Exophiala viscosa]|uniref:U-box domain-containing protein n=1 Tax=Exophiala viscosa TaxID=2486360 RepID=A0AAN6DSQ8_9EURO|nr:U-box domain-containing protein [Exophiala viscosa]
MIFKESFQGDNITDNFIMVNRTYNLPHRPHSDGGKDDGADQQLTIAMHPIQHVDDHFLVSIQPPKVPKDGLKRISCDIVLVIDVSGSMNEAASLPDVADKNERESTGLSILDLTKHAARTILESLTDNDRLGIVTFSSDAKIVQELTSMTKLAKLATWKRIQSLRPESYTNLWAGVRAGLKLFEVAKQVYNVQGMFVLTDGMPNHMCPPQGYVFKLREMVTKADTEHLTMPTIHTFGFGYQMRSELMQSIAEVGNGIYSFIPDAGMIGTVFVHAIANLFTTYATSARLNVEGLKVARAVGFNNFEILPNAHVMRLGNLQYGQSRQFLIRCPGSPKDAKILIKLDYQLPDGTAESTRSRTKIAKSTNIPLADADLHISRAQLCDFLSSLFPLKQNGEHMYIKGEDKLVEARNQLDSIVTGMEALAGPKNAKRADGFIWSLLEDLKGDDPAGQVFKALECSGGKNYWMKWGRHYLPSLLHAHQRQLCNTFKDPGPLMYGKDSPMFSKYRDELDETFNDLPPPKPSRPERVVPVYAPSGEQTGTRTIGHSAVASMKSFNNSDTPCFDGDCLVKTAAGTAIAVKDLEPGMLVWSPAGARKVAAVVKTKVRNGRQICRVGELLVTWFHPLKYGEKWEFPINVADKIVPFVGYVYSVMLAPSNDPNAHAIEVGKQICVTLGHGVVEVSKADKRGHPFFGDYRKVMTSLARLPVDRKGHVRCGGLKKSRRNGLAFAFKVPAAGRNISRG